jgi:hypothetical protein
MFFNRENLASSSARMEPAGRGQLAYNKEMAKRRPLMSVPAVTLEAVVKPDGTLELGQKLSLPPGRVQITIVPMPELPSDDPFWERMQALWDGQQVRGHVPRNAQDVEEERQTTRQEWEERMRRIEQIQEEAARLRRGKGP